jgi:hypothetical protein
MRVAPEQQARIMRPERDLAGQTTPASSSIVQWVPLIVVEAFLNATILVFAWSSWPIDNPVSLYLYVGAAHLLLALGYYCGSLTVPRACPYAIAGVGWRQVLVAGILVSLVLSPIILYVDTGGSINFIPGFLNPGDTYVDSRLKSQQGLGVNALSLYAGQMRILSGFLILCVLPAGALYWNRISTVMRVGVLAVGVAHILESAGAGRNKGLADIVILLPWLVFLKNANRLRALFTLGNVLIISGVALAALFGLWAYFNKNIAQRTNDAGVSSFVDRFGNATFSLRPFESDNLNRVFTGPISYCTQGYYGLARSLELPFEWTYGVGNSPILTIYAEKYLAGDDAIRARTYARRVEDEYGWNAEVQWSTVYPWLAGDCTFPGTLVVVFILGLVLAMTWRDSIESQNYLAATVFIWLMLGLGYFSANNQLMQMGQCVLGFWVALLLWWASRSGIRLPSAARISAI